MLRLVFPVIAIGGFITIIVLGITLFVTHSVLVMRILGWIGMISFLLAMSIFLLEYSGFLSLKGGER